MAGRKTLGKQAQSSRGHRIIVASTPPIPDLTFRQKRQCSCGKIQSTKSIPAAESKAVTSWNYLHCAGCMAWSGVYQVRRFTPNISRPVTFPW